MTAVTALLDSPSANPLGIPLRLSWTGSTGHRPLPRRAIRSSHRTSQVPAIYSGNGYLAAALPIAPFDFSERMRRLCADIVTRCEFFHHIEVQNILFGVSQARTPRRQGMQAKVTPMRFRDGHHVRQRRGRLYQVQRYWVDGVEILYLMSFCLPRFLDQSFDEKFVTVFHELYHIAPAFNGDLRRHAGRCSIHTHSQKRYDRHMADLVRHYLEQGASPELHGFLRLNFRQLEAHHGMLFGLSVPAPKLVPLIA